MNDHIYTEEDLSNEGLLEDYSIWLSSIKETLPLDERKRILSRIRHKEIARQRKIAKEFKNQFD